MEPAVVQVAATDWAPIISAALSLITLLAGALIKFSNDRANERNTDMLKRSSEKQEATLSTIHVELNSKFAAAVAAEFERGQRDARQQAVLQESAADQAAEKVVRRLLVPQPGAAAPGLGQPATPSTIVAPSVAIETESVEIKESAPGTKKAAKPES